MNRENLEGLLIDRALGDLSPGAEDLLAAYLRDHPEHLVAADDVTSTVVLAAAALRNPRLAPAPIARLAAVLRHDRLFRSLRMAASFVAGAGLTALGMRAMTTDDRVSPSQHSAVSSAQAPAQERPPTIAVRRPANSLPFWSNKRVYLVAQGSRQSSQGGGR